MNDVSAYVAAGLPYPKFKKHFSEFIGIGEDGHLWVEGRDVVELADTFGTPLYVISENQFRHNYRRFRDAFASRYPKSVEVLFANKCNNGIAIRHIMNQEGAGGDAFGINEMYLALLAGTDPKTLVLNGSNKGVQEIEMAIVNGICINIDAMDEIDMIEAAAERLNRDVDVGVRVKLLLKGLENRFGAETHGTGSLAEQARGHKWGMTIDQTVELFQRIHKNPRLIPKEISYHLSRMDNKAADFAVMAREMIEWSAQIRDKIDWTPPYVDLGGGWAFGRPEKTGPDGADDETASSFEEYAEAVTDAIKDECEKHGVELPGIKIEPGRAIAASAGITLGRVGAVKEWPGVKKWVNVDASTNHIMRIATSHWYHHIVAANKADAPATETVSVVGPLCSLDELGDARELPELVRGDLVALLDTGSYTESTAGRFNAERMPATVLVCGDDAEVTTERERLSDVIGRYKAPARLLAKSFGAVA